MTPLSTDTGTSDRSRIRAVLALGAAAAVTLGGLLGTAPRAAADDWTTVWSDDFNGAAGSTPSSATWRTITGTGFGTGEIERTTTDRRNVSLDGRGDLAITPLRDGTGGWTSGRLESVHDGFQPPVGGRMRLESRLQLPAVNGAAAEGYWPAFWSLGTGLRQGGTWPDIGELDVLEAVNGQDLAYGTMHCGVFPGGPCKENQGLSGKRPCPGSNCWGAFHTYTMEWDRSTSPETIRWSVDGQQYSSVSADQVGATTWNHATSRGIYVLYDLAIGGGFPDGVAGHRTPTATTEPGHPMLIDSVRVQTSGGAGAAATADSTAAPGTTGSSTTPVLASSPAVTSSIPAGTTAPSALAAPAAPAAIAAPAAAPVPASAGRADAARPAPTATRHRPRTRVIVGLSGKCIDVPRSNGVDGQQLNLWTCNGTAAQRWRFRADGTVRAFGLCMDDAAASRADGTPVQLARCNGTAARRFAVTRSGALVNRLSKRCVDVRDADAGDGAAIQQWTCTGGPNQHWHRR